jgi:acyl-CoA synthetase (AMP-forming)/AMP-acid ligase II
MEMNLADLFELVVDEVGGTDAVVSPGRRLTYAGLDRRADRLAHHLAASGVRPGDRVGVQLANGTEYLEVMLACFKVRAVPVNVNYRYVTGELEYLYRDAGLVGLVYHRRFGPAVAPAVGALAERRVVLRVADGPEPVAGTGDGWPAGAPGDDYEEVLAGSPEGRDHPARSAADLYCVYTGGTTGMPKGVLWRHDDIFFAAMGGGDPFASGNHITRPEELAQRILRPGVTALAIPPFMHAAGHWLAFSTFFGGGTVVTTRDGGFDAVEAWNLVETERVNALVVVGDAMARPLLDVLAVDPERYDLSSLMAVGSGGAVLSPSTKAQLAELLPGRMVADRFGSSETGQVGGEAPADDPFGPPRLRVDDRTDVFGADLEPVAPGSGTIGHLARGGHVPLGYLGDEAATATTFVERLGQRWALPGDQATVAIDGTITVLGRGSLCINSGGEKIFPDEVEAALKGHPAVADALVVGVDDERFGQRVVALVQLRPGLRADSGELSDHAHRVLTGYKVPRQYVFVDEVVRSPSGKPDYPHARSVAEAHGAVVGA